jgi:hypothetical protein
MKNALLLVALVGCSNSMATGFEVDGFVSGSAPQSGTVVAVWDTSGGTYKWGDGTSSGTSFTATLDFTPPPGIEFGTSGVAVGNLVLVPDGTVIADGTIDLTTLSYLGISTGYSIIYKDALASGLGLTWDESFGGGYSCAQCITPITGKDIYQLTPCANVTIDIGSTRTCNWN